MLSGVHGCQHNFDPFGWFCLRVFFYCTVEARLGRPISTCWGLVTSCTNVLLLALHEADGVVCLRL